MPKSSPKINKPKAVQVQNLTFAYEDEDILQNVSFEIAQGTVAAIIGPNGSGKTTLLKAILGLVRAKKGTIEILGQPLHHVRQAIGYVPQVFDFDRTFPITVKEFLILALHPQNEPKNITRVIKDVGLKKTILSKQLGTLSGGQLQRVMIAQAIINDPAILILDEPSTGIDVIGEAAFNKVITHLKEKHGTTVILVSHDISMVAKAVDQVICINKKLMCFGPPQQALTEKTLEKLYGESSSLFEHKH